MAPSFIFPQSLEALNDADSDYPHLSLQTLTPVSSLSPADLEEFVKGVSFDLSDKELFSIEEQDLFDRVYSLVNGFSCLPLACKFNLTDSLRSNLSVLLPNVDSLLRRASLNRSGNDEIERSDDEENRESSVGDRVASHRNAFKIYTFFLVHIVLIEEANSNSNSINPSKVAASSRKKQVVNSWNWEPQRGRVLNLIANSLEINLSSLFGSFDPDENYLSFIVKNAFLMFENAALLKHSESKDALCRIVGTCATKYHYIAQACASILHLIHKYDYVVIPLADAVSVAEKKYADGSLATSLVREVGRTNPKDYVKDTVGAENIGRFLVEVADRMPKLISTNIGLLVPHFGGESYKIRNALVGVLGKLVIKGFNDVEGEISSKSIRLRTKQAMLEILLERCRDVSAYTRSRVLQVWAELCEENSVSIGLWNEVTEVATGRLEDKSAIVRKSALNLLIMMLQHNPFGPQLRAASFSATLEQYRRKLLELEQKGQTESDLDRISSGNENICGDGEVENEVNEDIANKHDDSLPDSLLNEEGLDCRDNCVPDFGNLEQTRTLVASLEAGLRFSNFLSATMPTLVQLMSSSSATDVENTILLLMRCRQFQIDGSEDCLRKMLPLVFSQDKSIYEAVENAFITIYIRKNPIESAKNLINLAVDSNIGDLAALESIVGALVSKGDITSAMISALWDFFCFNINGTKAEQSRGALSILCMAAKSISGVFSAHLQDIVDIGFGRWAKVDPLLARTACIALQRLSDEDRKRLLSSNGGRLFDILESLITGPGLSDKMWYAAAEKAIATIYAIHPTPETIAAGLVKRSLSSVFRNSQTQELQDDIDNIDCSIITTVPATRVSRYLFLVSHIAMNHLVYIESSVREIQKERRKKENIGVESVRSATKETSTDTQKDSGINAELGVAASEDAEIDCLSEKAEKEIISGGSTEKNLIGQCAPFLSKLCRNLNLMKKYPELQASGMLALCQFMIIDADFCSANLQLLFTVVEGSPSDTVRSNCTIALGDLAVRFPNLLEPWTENMYARLRDPSATVRKNAVLVLSHLILNDMMKVKGYINEMTICLEDEDERIASLAKLFFNELSKKGANPIYNLLPDILGRLSSQNLKEEAFCNIMQFLIGSIKKDKQMESLVEKLCNRFSGVSDGKQWEYISYCLSQLAFTEKSMRKLIESFKTYEHVLSNGSVMDHFRNIINKAKKFAKPELKSCIEEFEEKINRFHIEKKDQEVTTQNAQAHQQKVDSLEGIVAAKRDEDSGESDIAEEGKDGEVTDTSSSDMSELSETKSEVVKSESNSASGVTELTGTKSEVVKSESNSASGVTEPELDDDEIQSPCIPSRGAPNSRVKKSFVQAKNGAISTSRRVTRSRKN